MKKTISFFLTLVMVLTLACSVSATEETKGTITIKNVALKASEDSGVLAPLNKYSLYKLLDLESYEDGIYFYTVAENWKGFFETEGAKKYFTVDNAGYVTAKDGIDNEDMPAFGQLALEYAEAEENGITADYNSISNAELTPDEGNTTGTLEFSDLALGYYLVDSTVGTLCALNTTNPSVEIKEKNEVPGVEKEVKEGETWGESNTAKIGDTVEFKATITVAAGAQNYVLHDAMTEGLTYQGVTEVKLNDRSTINSDCYAVEALNCLDGCDFEVSFNQNFVADLKSGDTIVVYYTAILNGQAKISPDKNINTSRVQYGENNHFNYTPDNTTETYTYSFDIVKTDAENKLLDGAKFKIYDAETEGNEIKVILDGEKYRPATQAEIDAGEFQAIEVTDGTVTLVGFDKGIYYLEEIEAPAGYNKLNARHKVEIGDNNLDNLSASFTEEGNYLAGGFQVINRSGTELPETGARGTALFITFGMIVVLGAGVLLVTKKRMGMIQE